MNLLRGKMALSMVASMSLVLTTVIFASGSAALASGGATSASRDMVLVGTNAVQPVGDTLTYVTYNAQGQTLWAKTIPAPADSVVAWNLESRAQAASQHQPFISLQDQTVQQIHAQMTTMQKSMAAASQSRTAGETVSVSPQIACGTSARVTGAYTVTDANTRLNYAVDYYKTPQCSIGVGDYAANLKPSTTTPVYQCDFNWYGNDFTPDEPVPNFPDLAKHNYQLGRRYRVCVHELHPSKRLLPLGRNHVQWMGYVELGTLSGGPSGPPLCDAGWNTEPFPFASATNM